MKLDLTGVFIALLVTSITFFVFVKTTDILGLCLYDDISNVGSASNCIAQSSDLLVFSPAALSIAVFRSLLIPVFSFALGILYYFKGHPVENWSDILLPSFVIGSLSGIITFVVLISIDSTMLLDLFFLFAVLSWVGLLVGMAVICAVLGGLVLYLLHKKQ